MKEELQDSGMNSSIYNSDFGKYIHWHYVWQNWSLVNKTIYKQLGITNIEEFIILCNTNPTLIDKIMKSIYIKTDNNDSTLINELKVQLIRIYDYNYPKSLSSLSSIFKDIHSGLKEKQKMNEEMRSMFEKIYPPLLLYSRGLNLNFNNNSMVAVVGTRKCSKEGSDMAYQIGNLIASYNNILVTGFADGIDTAATEGALSNDGIIIEVRPWLEPIEPKSKLKLIYNVMQNGCFISENLVKTNFRRWINTQFFLRNRIIAGMSKAVILIEARDTRGSGTMHQLEFAMKMNKPVFIWKSNRGGEFDNAFNLYVKKGAQPFRNLNELESLLNNV